MQIPLLIAVIFGTSDRSFPETYSIYIHTSLVSFRLPTEETSLPPKQSLTSPFTRTLASAMTNPMKDEKTEPRQSGNRQHKKKTHTQKKCPQMHAKAKPDTDKKNSRQLTIRRTSRFRFQPGPTRGHARNARNKQAMNITDKKSGRTIPISSPSCQRKTERRIREKKSNRCGWNWRADQPTSPGENRAGIKYDHNHTRPTTPQPPCNHIS